MLTLDILTEQKEIFKGEADFIILPGGEGEIGVLSGHAPLLSTLSTGLIRCRKGKEELKFQVEGGFVEIRDDLIQVISPQAEAIE